MIQHIETPLLRMAVEIGGPETGTPLFLLHGWPDDPRTYDRIAPALQAAGFRTIAPWLRGFGPTSFLSAETMRSGQIAALAQDVLDLADVVQLDRFAIVRHDWGARIAYLLASVLPNRITRIAALSVAWQPGGLPTPDFEQARHYWYQWFMATERGAAAVRKDGKAFARDQWENWGPKGWFRDADFETTAKSFDNPDWSEITLHSYRVRWGEAAPDPRYAALEAQALAAKMSAVPTLMIQGGADHCTLPRTTESKERYFSKGYERRVLRGVGHFPTREAPQAVDDLLLGFLKA
ncbi:MAG: alpha/beta fold hydrolase [Methylovirgula sp.]